ncbi:MAG: hypothetical protein N3J91_02245 [Verrucomicrobiae bacterium]|nr:hypothetical protein [Verrucomicrobiae bacterium]
MSLAEDINDIREGLRAGRYKNEASVSQGIILRLLNALGWAIYDTTIVCPEYNSGNGRVDFALCHPPSKPVVIVESKDIGNAVGAEKQLFEYAFHHGIPMAILTDGQEWSFFLPAEQGNYHERCVYKLDLVARTTDECCRIFERYLKYAEVASGKAITNAREDHGHSSRQRQMAAALPQAFKQLIEEQDEILVDLIAEKVETLCGFKPEPEVVRDFLNTLNLNALIQPQPATKSESTKFQPPPSQTKSFEPPTSTDHDFSGFTFEGRHYREESAIGTLFRVLDVFRQRDPSFLERYAALPKHGRKRRYLARNKLDLYPGRPDLSEQYSEERFGGWWIGTNYSRSTIRHAIELACEVAGVRFGKDLKLI